MVQPAVLYEPDALQLTAQHASASHDLLQLGDIERILEVAWRMKWVILVCGILGAVVGGVYYYSSPPVYRSKAQVLVVQKRPYMQGIGERGSYLDDDFNTHVTLITSPMYVRQAVEEYKLDKLPSFHEVQDPVVRISRQLTVSRSTKDTIGATSSILDLSFRGPIAVDCPKILTSVISNYESFLHQASQTANEDSLNLITQKAAEVQQQLESLEKRYHEFREQERPEAGQVSNARAILEGRVQQFENERADHRLRKSQIREQLAAIQGAIDEGHSHETLLAIIVASSPKEENSLYERMQEKLLPLYLEEKELLEDYGRGHPDVLLMQKKISFTQQFFVRQIRGGTDEGSEAEITDPVVAYVDSLKREMQNLNVKEKALQPVVEELNAKLAEYEVYMEKEQRLTRELERTQKHHEMLTAELVGVNLTKGFVGNSVSAIAPASPAVQVEPNALLLFTLPTALGLFFGLFLTIVLESMDKSFRTPDELQRRLQIPVFGHVPYLPADEDTVISGSSLDPRLCTYFTPRSIESEAFRAVRTALYFSTLGPQSTVIQVASPNVGDGKSTLAANLAVSMAQTGRRCLLVDADLRNPKQHRIFGVSNEAGLASLIAGTDEVSTATHSVEVPDLFVLTSGPPPSNPSELLTSPRLEEIIESLRGQFDFVLIDSPALLAVTDPSIVSARADGVLLVVRVTKNGRPRAERAKEIHSTIGAKVIGVVVNGIDFDAGNRSYATPRYDYRRTYQFDRSSLKYYADQRTNSGKRPRTLSSLAQTDTGGRSSRRT